MNRDYKLPTGWTLSSSIKKLLLSLMIMTICLEMSSYAFIYYIHKSKPRLAPLLPFPDFNPPQKPLKIVDEEEAYKNARKLYDFWYYPEYDFGTWHKPNISATQHFISKSITYTSNSYGMRDKEREKTSTTTRALFLGDSFVEGLGVADDDRATNILEKTSGTEILNFGMNGNCGPVQEWLIYKHFSSVFSHDAVFLGLFPANDFWDLDMNYNYNLLLPGMRPFLEGQYPNYSIVYRGSGYAPPKLSPQPKIQTPLHKIKIAALSHSATARVWGYVKGLYRGEIPTVPRIDYSGYYDFTQDQWDCFRYSLEQIIKIAAPRPVQVFILPYYEDFVRREREGSEKPPLIKKMEGLSKELGFSFLDLFPGFKAQGGDMKRFHLFTEGDGHWNQAGNKLAAELMYPVTKETINRIETEKHAKSNSTVRN